MKKLFPIFLLTFFTSFSFAQEEYLSQTTMVTVYSKDIVKAKIMLMNIVDSTHAKVLNYKEEDAEYHYGKSITIKISTDKINKGIITQVIDKLGYAADKKIETTDSAAKVNSLNAEILFLKKQKDAYQAELEKVEKSNTNYSVYWNQIRTIEEKIFEQEKQVMRIKDRMNNYTFNITLTEDIGTPQETRNQDVNFVNMPGVEYNYYKIETPKAGLSATLYQGGGIKYLFTRGKSYFTFGAMKSVEQITDSTSFKEMFLYSFGQDFYPRHFGRGHRKFLNLYTGYSVGGMFATSETSSRNIFYLCPQVGLEFFKNNYILLDTHAGYMIPFYENKNTRGIIANASFNFLF